MLPDGTTLMEAIAKRDILKLRRGLLETLASSAVPVQERFTRTELKYVPTVDVAELRKEVDRLSKAYRELDASIQAAPLSAVEASQIRCSSSIIAPMPILGRIQKIPGVWRPAAK